MTQVGYDEDYAVAYIPPHFKYRLSYLSWLPGLPVLWPPQQCSPDQSYWVLEKGEAEQEPKEGAVQDLLVLDGEPE